MNKHISLTYRTQQVRILETGLQIRIVILENEAVKGLYFKDILLKQLSVREESLKIHQNNS